jgi:hypothetical protein
MRLLLAAAACGLLFAGALWAGTKVLPTGADPTPYGDVSRLGTTTAAEETTDAPKRAKKKSNSDRHDPRKRLVRADMAIARRAVLHPKDVGWAWTPAPVPRGDGPGCPANDPDRSRFTITGVGRSLFVTGTGHRSESRVTVFANAGQAALNFEATNNRTILRCIRDGIKRSLRREGLRPRVLYARLQTEPSVGSQTAIYLVGYRITLSDGSRWEWPVEMLTFRVGRAIGALQYIGVVSPDGSRPCQCELDEARLVASRLSQT